ncbi:MAG TPA: chemotaxis protein CheD [Leptospiraceae bacterium]|nr:chemotaxis protein CheD [Spirochaetaceae bacterium]HBS04650.1 chemotaxis protein CheD [Leptospiraceae bacterium]|tara:strand:- start:37423 stop:37899 length:477 start_codon:yes stop_codon:yes gene_type:complete
MIHLGVAEWKAAKSPDAIRTTLGSCVGIVLYSAKKKIGGVSHVLLADPPAGRIVQRGKYARTAIDMLLADLQKLGIEASELSARIFGGASMFDAMNSAFFNNIGQSNVTATRETLEARKIPIVEEDVGGNLGRTITLYLDDGRVLLRANGQERYLYKT